MTLSPNFQVEVASVEDVPAIVDVWYASFNDPEMRAIWPDTPEIREWWHQTVRNAIVNKTFQRYVKVMDLQSTDAHGRARVVAYAVWDLSMPEERGPRYPPWHDESLEEMLKPRLERVEHERLRVMGGQKHYYLDTLATHPDYRHRGIASALIEWGCTLADKNGVPAYVDASKEGAGLYQKFGFVDKSLPESAKTISMGRWKQE